MNLYYINKSAVTFYFPLPTRSISDLWIESSRVASRHMCSAIAGTHNTIKMRTIEPCSPGFTSKIIRNIVTEENLSSTEAHLFCSWRLIVTPKTRIWQIGFLLDLGKTKWAWPYSLSLIQFFFIHDLLYMMFLKDPTPLNNTKKHFFNKHKIVVNTNCTYDYHCLRCQL